MNIFNLTLRKSLGMKFLEADDGAGTGGENPPTDTPPTDTPPDETKEEEKKEEKSFTQAELDNVVKERIAREKKNSPSKEELKAFKEWQDSKKTDEEKTNEKITKAEKARLDAETRATALEAKVSCLSKGVNADSTDDVVALAQRLVTDDVDINKAIDTVLKKYPSFKSTPNTETKAKITTGTETKQTEQSNDEALRKAFGL